MRDYMTMLNAQPLGDDNYQLRGSRVSLRLAEPISIASVSIPRIEVLIDAEDEELEAEVVAAIRLKALRGGG